MDSQAAHHWVVDLCGHSVKHYLQNRRGIEEKCARESVYRESRDGTGQKYALFLRDSDTFIRVLHFYSRGSPDVRRAIYFDNRRDVFASWGWVKLYEETHP